MQLCNGLLPGILGCLFFVLATTTNADGGNTAIAEYGTKAEEHQQARGIYAGHCAMCHGDTGEGYKSDYANALSNQDFLTTVSDQFLWSAIARGRPRTAMAAHLERYGGPLDEMEIDLLVNLIRSWQIEDSVALSPATVTGNAIAARADYAQHCAACHGDHGQGVNTVSLNNPEFLATASDHQIRRAIAKGRRNTAMIGFEQSLSSGRIDNLVALIRSWQQAPPQRKIVEHDPLTEEVVINPKGNPPRFSPREGRYVSADQVFEAMQSGARLVILDSRPTSDWHFSRIPGSVSAPHYDPESIIDWLPRDGTWIVSYCACPHTYSNALTDKLRAAGFANTVVLDEGFRWWQDVGYPVE